MLWKVCTEERAEGKGMCSVCVWLFPAGVCVEGCA